MALAAVLALAGGAEPGHAQEPVDAETLDARRAAVNGLLSLAIPGSGQLRQEQRRGWAYLALEAVAWSAWLERRHRGGELRTRYRDLAWQEGRIRSGPRVDGDFPYYETLSTWTRSGAFDVQPSTPGIQPEMDADTYNGSIWALARGLFLPPEGGQPGSPEWRRALDYYEDRAYGEPFLWDWSASPGGQAEVARLIEESDDRFRQATLVLGAVLLNHAASAVDAWLSTSLHMDETTLRVVPSVLGPRGAWTISLHIGALP